MNNSGFSASTVFFVLVLVLALAAHRCQAKPACPPEQGMSWMGDPNDCSVFYVCHASQRFEFSCGKHVWDAETKTCVPKGSTWDTCTAARELNGSRGEPCSGRSSGALIAKSDNCAQYYNCSSRTATVSNNPFVVECQYPLLFNTDTKRCERFEAVKCGTRWEPLDACDYVANTCQRAHCIPCNVRFPSCRGLPDGMNPWVGREPSPYFVLCQAQRALYQGMCDNSNGPQIFDSAQRVCAPVPKEK